MRRQPSAVHCAFFSFAKTLYFLNIPFIFGRHHCGGDIEQTRRNLQHPGRWILGLGHVKWWELSVPRAWFLTVLRFRLKGLQPKKQIEVELTADDTGFLMLKERFPLLWSLGHAEWSCFLHLKCLLLQLSPPALLPPTLLLTDLNSHTKLKKTVIREFKKPYCMKSVIQ